MSKILGNWSKLIAIMAISLVFGSCGGKATSTGGGAGSDTSWLRICVDDDGCSVGHCFCGVCTEACSEVSQCSDVAESSECIVTDGLAACDSAPLPAPKKVCSSEPVTSRLKAESATESDEPGDSPPSTTNKPNPPDKLDLLFVVDNSFGMANGQTVLTDAVPEVLQRLTAPHCVSDGNVVAARSSASEECPKGSQPEFRGLTDIHVGVITTSLGGYGAPLDCVQSDIVPASEQKVDMARLLGSLPRGVEAGGGDFIRWTSGMNQTEFSDAVTAQISAAGEHGCGWEASLESWVRFLVDPVPHQAITRVNCPFGGDTKKSCIGPTVGADGKALVDELLLSQRRAFLRPDSMLGIVMLSNENDCSFRASGQSWRLAQALLNQFATNPAFRGTAACNADPNDECCHSCGGGAPAGCPTITNAEGETVAKGCEGDKRYWIPDGESANLDDQISLRCFEQKRRFGVDYLYPVERYSNALLQEELCLSSDSLNPADCAAKDLVTNPLFADLSFEDRLARDPQAQKYPPRPRSSIFLSGILGVPWQDLAVDPNPGEELVYRSTASKDPDSKVNWDWIIGDRTPANGLVRPADPLMRESIEPRSGTQPVTGERLAGPDASLMANSINGHEWTISNRDDLQYACIAPKAPQPCPSVEELDSHDPELPIPPCACTDYGGSEHQNPLCQSSAGYGQTQSYWGAYPSLRQLQVLHDLGEQAVPASICHKDTDKTAKDYGYRPALNALVDRLGSQLSSD